MRRVTLLHRLRRKQFELVEEDQVLASEITDLNYQKALRH